MLTYPKKMKIFKSYLKIKQNKYSNKIKAQIHFFFFENEGNMEFLDK